MDHMDLLSLATCSLWEYTNVLQSPHVCQMLHMFPFIAFDLDGWRLLSPHADLGMCSVVRSQREALGLHESEPEWEKQTTVL